MLCPRVYIRMHFLHRCALIWHVFWLFIGLGLGRPTTVEDGGRIEEEVKDDRRSEKDDMAVGPKSLTRNWEDLKIRDMNWRSPRECSPLDVYLWGIIDMWGVYWWLIDVWEVEMGVVLWLIEVLLYWSGGIWWCIPVWFIEWYVLLCVYIGTIQYCSHECMYLCVFICVFVCVCVYNSVMKGKRWMIFWVLNDLCMIYMCLPRPSLPGTYVIYVNDICGV